MATLKHFLFASFLETQHFVDCQKVQTETAWSDLAKFCHFGEVFKLLANLLRVYLIIGKILNPLWQNYLLLGKFSWPNIEQIFEPSGHTDQTKP